MKRTIVLAVGLALASLVGPVPDAAATGTAACTVSGTITFSAGSLAALEGVWAIGPAVISCHGLFNGYERILGPGSFTGSGTYQALPDGSGTCLRNLGTGTLDYGFPTSQADIHLVEPGSYTLAGAGAFDVIQHPQGSPGGAAQPVIVTVAFDPPQRVTSSRSPARPARP